MLRLLNVFLESRASGTAGRATLLPRLCLSCSWTCSQRAPREPEVAAESLLPRSLPHISPCTSTAAVPWPPLPFVLPDGELHKGGTLSVQPACPAQGLASAHAQLVLTEPITAERGPGHPQGARRLSQS